MFGFLRRNKRRFLIGSGTIAFLYFALGFIQKKFQEYQQRLTEERFQREQIRRRFEQTQKDALYTIYSLYPVLNGGIIDSLKVEEITHSLQQRRLEKGKNDINSVSDISSVVSESGEKRKTKNELWQELKIMSLTRLLTLIYSDALLVLFTRLQLNILARREYLEDALKLASKQHGISKIEMIDHSDYVNEQAYLSFSWWLLNRGWIQLRELIKTSVEEVFEEITPRYEMDVNEFAILLTKTFTLIESNLKLKELLLPPRNLENFVIQQTLDEETLDSLLKNPNNLRVLVDETYDYIDSNVSMIVLNSLIHNSMTIIINQFQSSEKLKLAVILATMTKLAHNFKQQGCEFINVMDKVGELDELSASVYSNFN